MTENRYRTGKGIFDDGYFSETIIDEKTGKKYYDGITPNYISSKKLVELLNQVDEENKQLKYENKRLKQGKYIYGIHGGSND